MRLANDTEYDLATTVWTANLARAHRVAVKIEARSARGRASHNIA